MLWCGLLESGKGPSGPADHCTCLPLWMLACLPGSLPSTPHHAVNCCALPLPCTHTGRNPGLRVVLMSATADAGIIVPHSCAFPSPTGRNPGLRVVLMSATADAGLFAGYFETALREPAGQLTIPGFTHPVTGGWVVEDCMVFVGLYQHLESTVTHTACSSARHAHAPNLAHLGSFSLPSPTSILFVEDALQSKARRWAQVLL